MTVEARPTQAEVIETIDTVRYFTFANEVVKATNDYLAVKNKETDQLNWYALQIYRGIACGLFAKMRNSDDLLIARHISLERGISQTLTPRQDRFLNQFDQDHGLTS
jgi:hypothetical protein